jgi:hypothetical protein
VSTDQTKSAPTNNEDNEAASLVKILTTISAENN